jgi:6,7-dimethyl-8-ribityllumazine synthase
MAEARRRVTMPTDGLEGARILVVEARFYDDIADALLDGARRAFEKARVEFDVVTVPGSLEIPAAIAMALDRREVAPVRAYDGAVALGCVIRGDTIHFEIVSKESARGLMNLAVDRAFPIGNGIITVDNEEQAWERAKPDRLDKGGDAARAALAMVRLKRSFTAPAKR